MIRGSIIAISLSTTNLLYVYLPSVVIVLLLVVVVPLVEVVGVIK
jgi:hypothetical protein